MSAVAPPPTDEERLARVSLSHAVEPGDPRLLALVAQMGAVEVLAALRKEARRLDAGAGLASRLDGVDAAARLDRAEARGLRFLIPGDSEWPTQLGSLDHAGDNCGRGRTPLGLWARGTGHLGDLTARSVAIVGSRSATHYGATLAAEISFTTSVAGWTTVSGAAFGIDQAAHRGALTVPAPTVAVLASGADRAYPVAHRELLDAIAATGVVVSEAPPGAAPTKVRFLARNRLIAALATGTVVVEAAIRSGALNTATWTERLSRVLMGVPGPTTSEPSAGVHQMIRSRGALLVTRGEEVLEAISPAGSFTLAEPREAARPHDGFSLTDQQVLDAVPVARAAPVANLARTSGLSTLLVSSALVRLESAGLVVRVGDRWRLQALEGVRSP